MREILISSSLNTFLLKFSNNPVFILSLLLIQLNQKLIITLVIHFVKLRKIDREYSFVSSLHINDDKNQITSYMYLADTQSVLFLSTGQPIFFMK